MTTTTETQPENGQLTKDDEYRREISEELSRAMTELHERTSVVNELKEKAKAAKADMDAAQRRVNRLADDLRDIEFGQYQPVLKSSVKPSDNGQEKPDPAAEWGLDPITVLTEYGELTEHACDLLTESKFEIKTVADLARVLREEPHWNTDISGVGPGLTDKISDALCAYQKANPVPTGDEEESEDSEAGETDEAAGEEPTGTHEGPAAPDAEPVAE